MRKKIIAALLSFCLLAGMMPAAFAASPASAIQSRLQQISSVSPYKDASYHTFDVPGIRSGCYAFLHEISMQLFGVAIPTQAVNEYGYKTLLNANSDWDELGATLGGNDAVLSLLRQSQPGDLIQYKSTFTDSQHIAMIYAVSADEITIYDNTSGRGVQINSFRWEDCLAYGLGDFSPVGYGLSLYRCNKNVLTTPIAGAVVEEEPAEVTVTTGAAEDITASGAVLCGAVESNVPVSEIGMCLGTAPASLTELGADRVSGTSAELQFDTAAWGISLEPDTVYYYAAYAEVEGETCWGETRSFRTAADGFADVPAGAWFADAVAYVSENNMMNGTSANRFSPDDAATRSMVVTILYRMEGEPHANAVDFADVSSDVYYADAVSWAAGLGLVNGITDFSFAPNEPITREQLAVILYRYAQYNGYDAEQGGMSLHEYTDAAQISSYAVPAMQWAGGEGLITGTSGAMLSPKGSATRAQLAVILMRLCEDVL